MCLRIDHPFKRSFAHHSSIPIRPRPHQTRGACYVIALTASPSQVKDAYKLHLIDLMRAPKEALNCSNAHPQLNQRVYNPASAAA